MNTMRMLATIEHVYPHPGRNYARAVRFKDNAQQFLVHPGRVDVFALMGMEGKSVYVTLNDHETIILIEDAENMQFGPLMIDAGARSIYEDERAIHQNGHNWDDWEHLHSDTRTMYYTRFRKAVTAMNGAGL